MRYETFKKARKKHKQALVAKLAKKNGKPEQKSETPGSLDDNDADENEDEMRDQIRTRYQSSLPRETTYFPRKQIGIEPVEGVRGEAISESCDANRGESRKKSPGKGFLPIAMPRSEASQDEDSEYEYRSDFDAPDHIELIKSTSHEDARTEVSDITQVTYGASFQSSRTAGLQFPPRAHERFAPHIEHLEDLEEGSEETEDVANHFQVDVTDLDNIHHAVHSVRRDFKNRDPPAPLVENRHGLPYESTDFRCDDDGSDDSWGEAIIGSRFLKEAERVPEMEPIDAEKFMADKVTRQGTPRSHASSGQKQEDRLPPKLSEGPTTPRSYTSVRETLSAGGEVIIDLSEVNDDDLNAIEVSKPSPKPQDTGKSPDETKERKEKPPIISPETRRSPHFHRTSPTSSSTQPREQAQPLEKRTKTAQTKDPEGKIQVDQNQLMSELRKDVPKESVPFAPANAFVEASMKAFNNFTDGLGTKLGRFDLLPENSMQEMLGVLNKDLTATSKRVPKGKDVVDYVGEQLTSHSCTVDNTLNCASPKQLNLTFPSMVGMVRDTYQQNVANCGLPALTREQSMQPIEPQTYMIPISLDQSTRHNRTAMPESRWNSN